MKDLIKEEFYAFKEDLIYYLSENQENFNNADSSSKQRVYSDEELSTLIKETILEVLK